jgi:hypothetical protein
MATEKWSISRKQKQGGRFENLDLALPPYFFLLGSKGAETEQVLYQHSIN